jgi:hypothetical protein
MKKLKIKRIIGIIGASVLVLVAFVFLTLYLWIRHDVKGNINTAKHKYPGKAEDALISYLLDTANPTFDRSSLAIWTLGQIHSEKALPVLHGLYKNDPEGRTCKGRHDKVLCQYEIHKAIVAIERGRFLSHSRLNR